MRTRPNISAEGVHFSAFHLLTVIIVVRLLKSTCIPSFILIGCCVSEIHAHLCLYRNVWPEAVYCCTTLFTKTLT